MMILSKRSKLNMATTQLAFLLLLLLAMLASVLFAQPVYAAEDTATPAKPSEFVAESGPNMVTLKWEANTESDLGGYNIYRNTTDTAVGAKLASVAKAVTSYEDTSVALGITYYYWLSAVDTATPENESEKAGPVSATVSISFKDITNAHWARAYIEELLALGIIAGYGDGSFRPESDVTRAEFAKMICTIMESREGWQISTETTTSFSDVQPSHWAFKYIATVREYGVMTGYNTDDGVMFLPDRKITRAEIAKIISTLLKLERGDGRLKDVAKHWAKEHINACVRAGIVSGYKDGNFKPNSFATRSEVCKMLVKMMKLLDTQANKGKKNKK